MTEDVFTAVYHTLAPSLQSMENGAGSGRPLGTSTRRSQS
jgi:hypothetical protein